MERAENVRRSNENDVRTYDFVVPVTTFLMRFPCIINMQAKMCPPPFEMFETLSIRGSKERENWKEKIGKACLLGSPHCERLCVSVEVKLGGWCGGGLMISGGMAGYCPIASFTRFAWRRKGEKGFLGRRQ